MRTMTPETWLNVGVKVDSEGTLNTEAASSLFIAVGWECVALGGVVACGQETAYGTAPNGRASDPAPAWGVWSNLLNLDERHSGSCNGSTGDAGGRYR